MSADLPTQPLDLDATAARVWNHGDPEPGMPVIAVRDSAGRLWVRSHQRDMWTHAYRWDDEGWGASHCPWSLVTLEGSPVTEVPLIAAVDEMGEVAW